MSVYGTAYMPTYIPKPSYVCILYVLLTQEEREREKYTTPMRAEVGGGGSEG